MNSQNNVSIMDYIKAITPREWLPAGELSNKMLLEKWIEWPPDIFALTSLILKQTGAYIGSVLPSDIWPDEEDWQEILLYEKECWYWWILNFQSKTEGWTPGNIDSDGIPFFLKELIGTIVDKGESVTLGHLQELFSSDAGENGDAWDICRSILTLHAFADEICRNFGTPLATNWTNEIRDPDGFFPNDFQIDGLSGRKLFRDYKKAVQCIANVLLSQTGTLSRLPPFTAKVLPKLRTPNVGLTIRNLSHHVTMHQTEVEVVWRTMPWVNIDEDTINMLIIPWPPNFEPTWFKPSSHSPDRKSKEQTRYFEYTGSPDKFSSNHLISMIDNAEKLVNRIHMVIFPELALTDDNLSELLQALAHHKSRGKLPMILAGIRSKDTEDRDGKNLGRNLVVLSTFFAGKWYQLKQDKHHRWKIDAGQIRQYNLSGVLAGNRNWWESISISQRKLSILAPNKWFALCPLICEDLARQEPVSELIRGIGPTMVTAILLDGPQLEKRWSGRYASVLADDPGSSVLTASSLGLAMRSTPRSGKKDAPIIALWKDSVEGSKPIEVESNKESITGVVLTVTAQWAEEITADGRSDNNSAAILVRQSENAIDSKSVINSDGHTSIQVAKDKFDYDLSEADDLLEITVFSYFVDAVLVAEEVVVEELKRWMVRTEHRDRGNLQTWGVKRLEDKSFYLWEKIQSEHESLKPFLDWLCNLIKEIKTGDDSFANIELIVDYVDDILDTVDTADFVSAIKEGHDPFVELRKKKPAIPEMTILQGVEKHKQVRVCIYGCLAMLWAVHARLNMMRRNGLLKTSGTKLLMKVEESLDSKVDLQWYRAKEDIEAK